MPLPAHYGDVIGQTDALESLRADSEGWADTLRGRTTSLLFSPTVAAAAADLESRFVEGALGNLHAADWRNFGHGRHHWLAKRAETTAVLAMVGSADETLAERTLSLLPPETPLRAVRFEGAADEQTLLGMLFALHLAERAGAAVGIDPGRPGVPEFGRKLYHLAPLAPQRSARDAAIARKARARGLPLDGELGKAHDRALERLKSDAPCALVLDYDGTLSDQRARYQALPSEMLAVLVRVAESGAFIGIATGRGRSAGRALQRALPASLRARVIIGYYDGSVVRGVGELPSDDEVAPSAASEEIARALTRLWPQAELEARRVQVSLRLPVGACSEIWVSRVADVAQRIDPMARILCSSHSVDVILDGSGKGAVVEAVRNLAGTPDAPVLRIGDKGRWPGNDADLLADPWGLSVDEVSSDLERCWNFAPVGVLGPQATLYYLSRLSIRGGRLMVAL